MLRESIRQHEDRSHAAGTALTEVGYLVAKAQDGDQNSREQLLRDYRPFYLKVAASVCRRYLVLGKDDEASIAMLAFDEAISSYDDQAGASFLSFSELVIKRRMVDFFRRRSRKQDEIPMSALETGHDDENAVFKKIESKEAFGVLQIQKEAEARREEIFRLNQILSDYGVMFSDLLKASPKHKDARERALEVAETLVADPQLMAQLTRRKALPLKQLQQRVQVSRKTLERQRKYIIALTLILTGEFYYMREYLKRPV